MSTASYGYNMRREEKNLKLVLMKTC